MDGVNHASTCGGTAAEGPFGSLGRICRGDGRETFPGVTGGLRT